MKKLSAEGRFECGLDEAVKGKVWAFVAVVGGHEGGRLGVAIANERGYWPIPESWAHGTYDEMQDHADELNSAEGLSKHDAAKIIISSMARKSAPQTFAMRRAQK